MVTDDLAAYCSPATDSSTRNTLTGTYSKSIQQLTLSNTQQVLTNPNNIINRPASAYYQDNASYIENANNTPKLLANQMVMSSDNLGKSASSLNINANGNSIHQSNTQQNHQQPQPFLNTGNRSKSTQNFNREGQSQNSLRMNQILAPSMPNISDARTTSLSPHIYNTGLLSSQSMQNVAMINQASAQQQHQHPQTQQQRIQNSGQSQQQLNNSSCFQPSVGDKSIRRNHRTDAIHDVMNQMIALSNSQQQEQFCPNVSNAPPKPHGNKYNLSAFSVVSSKQQHSQNIPNSSIRAPQNYQKHPNTEETPPLPPTTTHPLFKGNSQSSHGVNCVSSSSEPQKGSFYPINASLIHQGHFSATNPWQREEREKEQEIRKEHIRIWRDKQITNLSNLPHRLPQQEEQLKTLVLERDFERRTHEVEEQEEDIEPSFDKENDEEEKFRIPPITVQASSSNFCHTDNEGKLDIECLENRDINNKIVAPKTDSQVPLFQSYSSTVMHKKGILKYNRHDSSTLSITASSTLPSKINKNLSDEKDSYSENAMSCISQNVSNMNLDMNPNSLEHSVSGEHTSQSSTTLPIRTTSPPSPPERNISYIVMSQKQRSNINSNSSKSNLCHTETNNQYNNNKNGFLKSMPTQSLNDTQSLLNSNTHSGLLILGRDTKRVSFHDEENNYLSSQALVSGNEPDSDKMDIHSACGLGSMSNEILQSPQTPEADLWNLTVKSTPGVIGAQEVYRDPRQRRLAEQHEKEQQRSSDAVPEKLSFKEKMKMFALESGEDQTPKDKLKISRAQRDIDAAH